METDFLERIKRYIARHGMPGNGAKVLVALSGGADSVALLKVLVRLGYECVAAHCNFHLRGDESMRDERFVRQLCAKSGVPLEVRDFDVKARMEECGVSVEMACRDLRYEWFEALRQDSGCSCIAVAHHRDDNVETLMLNLLRGTGIAGAAGIKPVNGHIVRPLLCVSRIEIENYLGSMGQDYVIDSTNAENDVKRNRLRNIVLPAIRECFPAADAGLARTLGNMLSCYELYESLFAESAARYVADGGECIIVDLKAVAAGPGAEAMLFGIMHRYGFNSEQVDDILTAYGRGNAVGRTFYAAGYKAVIDRDRIVVAKGEVEQSRVAVNVADGAVVAADGLKLTIKKMAARDLCKSMCDGRHKVCFGEAVARCGDVALRHWQAGDRFKPFGMKGRSRLVSDLFTDMKLTDAEKRRVWLLEADGEIVWVVGCRSAEAYRVEPGNGGEAYLFSAE